MLIPTIANRLSWFYAVGNTPATNLTRSIPHGEDAQILTLGCGDLRNVLYTAHVERGLGTGACSPRLLASVADKTCREAPRKLDVSCCDIDGKIIGWLTCSSLSPSSFLALFLSRPRPLALALALFLSRTSLPCTSLSRATDQLPSVHRRR